MVNNNTSELKIFKSGFDPFSISGSGSAMLILWLINGYVGRLTQVLVSALPVVYLALNIEGESGGKADSISRANCLTVFRRKSALS